MTVSRTAGLELAEGGYRRPGDEWKNYDLISIEREAKAGDGNDDPFDRCQ
jgi:hypothetical protein